MAKVLLVRGVLPNLMKVSPVIAAIVRSGPQARQVGKLMGEIEKVQERERPILVAFSDSRENIGETADLIPAGLGKQGGTLENWHGKAGERSARVLPECLGVR